MNSAARNTPVDQTGPGGPDPSKRTASVVLTVLLCAVLALFGMAQAVLGTFFYSVGPAPLAALGFDLAIFATCLVGGWGLGRPLGGVIPALSWFLVAFILASGTSTGSVLITATTAGEWFLFGGAACATAGMIAALYIWSKFGHPKPRP